MRVLLCIVGWFAIGGGVVNEPALHVRESVPLNTDQPAVALYVQVSPDASVAPSTQPPLVPVGAVAGSVHESAVSTGFGVSNAPSTQCRSSAPLCSVHPPMVVYVQSCECGMTAPAVHPPLVPGGAAGSVQPLGLNDGSAVVNEPALHVRARVPLLSV